VRHREHRLRVLEALQERGAAGIFPTASHKTRNFDTEYRFRPDSDFVWLTGFAEPDSVLVLLPALPGAVDFDGKPWKGGPRSILYLRERDRSMEIWTGRRLGVERAPERLGVDCARPIEKLWSDLSIILKSAQRLMWRFGVDVENDRRMTELLGKLRMTAKGPILPPIEMLDTAPVLGELRLKKSKAELDLMRRAAATTKAAHIACMAAARPGKNECEIDALLEWHFRASGGTGAAYNNIVASGANATILHYNENNAVMKDGDLLLIDAGAEHDWYACDVTRTFPVNGRFSKQQRALYEVVLEAQLKAIAHVQPGVSFVSVHETALRALIDGLVRLGLLSGSVDEQLKKDDYRRFYMHRTSHWLGLDVHDCGAYNVDGTSRRLEAGMVLTVEPGLYVAEDDTTVGPEWRGIGIRIEDDVLVTSHGHEVLTTGIPKTVEEVEAACALAPVAVGAL
jgi:Xaa-Pro aminopeptidase